MSSTGMGLSTGIAFSTGIEACRHAPLGHVCGRGQHCWVFMALQLLDTCRHGYQSCAAGPVAFGVARAYPNSAFVLIIRVHCRIWGRGGMRQLGHVGCMVMPADHVDGVGEHAYWTGCDGPGWDRVGYSVIGATHAGACVAGARYYDTMRHRHLPSPHLSTHYEAPSFRAVLVPETQLVLSCNLHINCAK